jgi:lysophospholipase L1-like esterase
VPTAVRRPGLRRATAVRRLGAATGGRRFAGKILHVQADQSPPRIDSFAALGDSFTEGLDDEDSAGHYRGWADRFAALLGAHNPGLRYANLAIRGKRLREVAADQVPAAVRMAPDLVSIAAGGNDILRFGADPEVLAGIFDGAVARLRAAGCEVVVFTGFDTRHFPFLRLLSGKIATYNTHLRAIADRRQCYLADLWSMVPLGDARAWSADRLHLSPDGHRRVALLVSEVLAVPVSADWRDPWPPAAAAGWLTLRRLDVEWARRHAAPWVSRRLRGVSSGDGRQSKRPSLLPLQPGSAA